jgi:hypothetical protein
MTTERTERPRPRLTIVTPTPAGLARLFTALTGEPATAEEMQTLLDTASARRASTEPGEPTA